MSKTSIFKPKKLLPLMIIATGFLVAAWIITVQPFAHKIEVAQAAVQCGDKACQGCSKRAPVWCET